jgi:hypothetical protein
MIRRATTSRATGRSLLALLSLLLFCAAGATSALAQGTVVFDNRVVGSVISHVYLPLPANPGLVQSGNGTADYPVGTTDWTGWTLVTGGGFSAQLFAAPGADVPVDSLAPAIPITTFRTGAGAGFVSGAIATLPNAPAYAPVVTIQMRVWDNRGGTVPDWATAISQPTGTELVGVSFPINLGPLGSVTTTGPNLVGLQSFNLTYIPEPSSLGLVALSAFSLWFACRRK